MGILAPVRVLHVTKKLPPLPGGDATAVAGLSSAQRRKGYDVDVLCYRATGLEASDHVHLVGPAQTPAQLDRVNLRRIRAMRAMGRWAEENLPRLRPDLVHAHAVDVGWPVAQVARALGIPAVLTCHGVWFTTRGPGSPMGRLEKSLIQRGGYAAVTSVDAASVAALQGAGFPETRLVPNGVDPAEIGGHMAHDGPFRFVFVGRLVPQKGADLLVRAAALARSRTGIPFAVVLVGDGPQRQRLEDLAASLSVTDFVLFRGSLPRSELLLMLRTADAFVLPSRFEGFPIAILEAWAAGAPVIAAAVGGIPEVCKGPEANLVPPEDPERLANAMVEIISDPSRREAMARAGRSLVETRFTWDAVVDAYASVYAAALPKAQGPP